jgi:ABC-type phosphate transport system ATPase subunit
MKDANALVIDTSKLTKAYNGKPVLKSLDLKVPKNSIFGFPGPNGPSGGSSARSYNRMQGRLASHGLPCPLPVNIIAR